MFALFCRFKRFLHGAIVGSGPSGMYLASNLLKHGEKNMKIDFIEKLEFPYGLVRYGVAPDHQDVKNVTETFEKVFNDSNVRLIANVSVGEDVSLEEIRNIYDFVVLSYGQFKSKELFFENKDSFRNFYTASEFVSWYNNYPSKKKISLKNAKTAVVVGNGNVALDVARILMSDENSLKGFDVPDDVLEEFKCNTIENINVVARGDVYSASFTVKELRDCYKKFNSKFAFNLFLNKENVDIDFQKSPSKSRLLKLMNTFNKNAFFHKKTGRNLNFIYNEQVERLLPNNEQQKIKLKNTQENIPCDLLVTCIGFVGESLAPEIYSFDNKNGCVKNLNGIVLDLKNNPLPFLYCNGWIKTGPRGNIASAVIDAYETGQLIITDLKNLTSTKTKTDPLSFIKTKTEGKKNIYSFSDWRNTDLVEKSLGVQKGKVREKLDHVLTKK